jgi:hypothetical protein
MYVVYLEAPKGERPLERPFKAFSARPSAIIFASDPVGNDAVALIFEVADSDDARAAIAASRWAKVNLWELKCQHLSEAEEAEYERARNCEWERAKKLGPDAALKFLGLI